MKKITKHKSIRIYDRQEAYMEIYELHMYWDIKIMGIKWGRNRSYRL